jgi:DNA topoisomerase-2
MIGSYIIVKINKYRTHVMPAKPKQEVVDTMDDIEHMDAKTMYVGSFDRVSKYMALDKEGKIYKTELEHSPALIKCIDEPLVNTTDQIIKGVHVLQIWTDINPKTGVVTVYNSGKGISICIHEKISKQKGRDIYNPEVAFSMPRTGTNLHTKKGHDVGGTNGYGVKLTAAFAELFKLETVDDVVNLKYKQTFKNGLKQIDPPKITSNDEGPYVELSFLPRYAKFGYDVNELSSKPPQWMSELIDIIRLRVSLLACFAKSLDPNCEVVYMNKKIKYTTPKDILATMIDIKNDNYYSIRTQSTENKKHYLDYAIMIGTKPKCISVLNGIQIMEGSHFKHLYDSIIKVIKDKDKDKDRSINVKSFLWVVACGHLPINNWASQTKDKFLEKAAFFEQFDLSKSSTAINAIAARLIELQSIKDLDKAAKNAKNKKNKYEKYIPAKIKSNKNTLALCEGDSAMALMMTGLTIPGAKLNLDNTSLFSLGGVPTNVSKTKKDISSSLMDELQTDSDDSNDSDSDSIRTNDVTTIPTEKFWKSKVFGALVQALNLDKDKTYKADDELKTLNYGRVVICVDQDLDGRGNICALVEQMFYTFWPGLYDHGFICHWNSPIIRVTSKSGKVVKEFKYENDYKKWEAQNDISMMNVDYIKGLAGHDVTDAGPMFARFEDDVTVLTVNKNTKAKFHTYFGYGNSIERKEVLATPVKHLTDKEIKTIESTHSLSCNRKLDLDTKEFMQAAMLRTLKGLDGLTPVRRKILTTCLKHDDNKYMKVFQLGGRVASEMAYHHGDASMNGAIIKMSQKYLGSNYYPLLEGKGQFGTRRCKGKNHGSPRYVRTRLNRVIVRQLYDKLDTPNLPKQYEEGDRVEPQYYLPILPMCILEHNMGVSYAWALRSMARDLDSVCSMMKALSDGKSFKKKLALNTSNYTGEIKPSADKITMTGVYKKVNDNTIVITELPIGIHSENYCKHLSESKSSLISKVDNYSNDKILIKIKFKPDGLSKMISDCKNKGSDPIIEALGLRCTVTEHFNFINEHNIIEHFETAEDVVRRHFELNKVKYEKRIDRELLLLNWIIPRDKNIIRFIEVKELPNITGKTKVKTREILTKNGYDKINNTVINSNSKYDNTELKEALEHNKTYGYLEQIRAGDVSLEELTAKKQKLVEHEARKIELEKLKTEKPFPGINIFKQDIDDVREMFHKYETGKLTNNNTTDTDE